jgi:hypothetical protein
VEAPRPAIAPLPVARPRLQPASTTLPPLPAAAPRRTQTGSR